MTTHHELKRGDVVRLKQDVDRFSDFMVAKGARGVVVEVDAESLGVWMYERIDGAEEWTNVVWWSAAEMNLEDIDGDIEIVSAP